MGFTSSGCNRSLIWPSLGCHQSSEFILQKVYYRPLHSPLSLPQANVSVKMGSAGRCSIYTSSTTLMSRRGVLGGGSQPWRFISQQPTVCTRGTAHKTSWEHQPHSHHWSTGGSMSFLMALKEVEGSTTILGHEVSI